MSWVCCESWSAAVAVEVLVVSVAGVSTDRDDWPSEQYPPPREDDDEGATVVVVVVKAANGLPRNHAGGAQQ